VLDRTAALRNVPEPDIALERLFDILSHDPEEAMEMAGFAVVTRVRAQSLAMMS